MIEHITYLQEDVVELGEAIQEKALEAWEQPDLSFVLQIAALHIADASRAMTAARLALTLAASAQKPSQAETTAARGDPHAKP
jgi:hypothetical protein